MKYDVLCKIYWDINNAILLINSLSDDDYVETEKLFMCLRTIDKELHLMQSPIFSDGDENEI